MRAPDGTGLAKQFTSNRSRGARCGLPAAALPAITLLCCLFGAAAPVGAAAWGVAPDSSAEALLALQQAQLTAADGAATGVAFGGTAATFTVDSATQVTATVPAGATSGPIAVTTPGGTATSAASFTVTSPPAVPVVAKLQPTSGRRGATVIITGTGFAAEQGTSYVKFGTLKVTVTTAGGTSNSMSFKVKR